jgi:hypothetical protein
LFFDLPIATEAMGIYSDLSQAGRKIGIKIFLALAKLHKIDN